MSLPHTLLLDTNIISMLMRDPHGALSRQLDRARAQVADLRVVTSVVVDGELRFGLARRASAKLQDAYANVMQIIEVLPLPPEAAEPYAALRAQLEAQGQPIGPNDALIAAHALALGATLVSGDDEFARVPGLKVENWLRPLNTHTA
ncbi:PIN domain-containing protein [Ottowia sp.]|uniref:PIN domain-containing protein n=1 Tax=Ottowia sp. TaxID=1898956 RepID=UPI002C3007F0|nr:PIN domain-containing protein [Ottowia sp.]HOB65558.1 PIN domain-containing protein [Ottowia sp.]HPZ58810.1 PIN domain-containing protein [Ottowia sp.]HQD46660.1 PIN domain-containing protein [Ottowia sp.]